MQFTIDSDKLDKKIQELNGRLAKQAEEERKKTAEEKKLQKDVKKLEDDYQPRLFAYEEKESKFNGRNSYSKTDEDATFMRMKEDHMRNGQLKPGYNVQVGTEDQFIIGYSLHQNRTDSGCLIPHLEKLKENLGRLPKKLIADSGYGSEENYEYLDRLGTEAYVKYNTFTIEQKRSFKKQVYRLENFPYNAETDEYVCPEGKALKYQYTRRRKTDHGYISGRRTYECQNCTGCPRKVECTRSPRNRRIEISFRLKELKAMAANKLKTDKGLKLRSQRAVEVESVFGRIKHNWSFRRFLLRGIEKVKIEWGLISIAHNLAKVAMA